MKRKDRRTKLFLAVFFLAAGIYIIFLKAWEIVIGVGPTNLFELQNGTIPVFNFTAQGFSALACLIASWSLFANTTWKFGWCLFTLGLLFYGNLISIGKTIYESPAEAIPMILIVLIVLQCFPFLIRNMNRYP